MYSERRSILNEMINNGIRVVKNCILYTSINIKKLFIVSLILIGSYNIMHSNENQIPRVAVLDPEIYKKSMWVSTWGIDEKHSSIMFSIDYMTLSKIRGNFESYAIKLSIHDRKFNNDFNLASVIVKIDSKSISTQNRDRDNHLKSRDFLSTDIHPDIEFNATLHKTKKENIYDLVGILYLNGVEKKIKLKATHKGTIQNINNQLISMFEIKGNINRKQHNITWNKILDNGGLLIGDDITLEANIIMINEIMYN